MLRTPIAHALAALCLFSACTDGECPEGFYRTGALCRCPDGGRAVNNQCVFPDAGPDAPDDVDADSAQTGDAAMTVNDSATPNDGHIAPMVEADAARMDATTSQISDGGTADAGRGDAAAPIAAVATVGTSCTTAATKACDAPNGRQKLICFNGVWSPNGSCDGDTRCQTRLESPEVGSCQPVLPLCVGKDPGQAVCDGSTRRACGPDLLDYASFPCPAHASCQDAAGVVSCRCEAPYMDDGAGGCATQVCLAMPCANGGTCNSSGSTRTCDCSGVDYEGPTCETKIYDCARSPCAHGGACTDGLRSRSCMCGAESGFVGLSCETNVNECASANVCVGGSGGTAFSYECRDLAGDVAGYTCRGQFPDWPISNDSNRFTVASGIVTDTISGLQWEHPTAGCNHNWESAKAHCAMRSAGGTGWRLPTRAELVSIVDYGRALPAIAQTAFLGTESGSFWSASSVVGGDTAGFVWMIDFSYGAGYTSDTKDASIVHCVRCVR